MKFTIRSLGAVLLAGSVLLTAAAAADPQPVRIAIAASKGVELLNLQKYLESNFNVQCVWVDGDKGKEVMNTEELARCDVMLLNLYRTQPTPEQLKRLQAYFQSGKPVVGLRKASHAIQNWLVIDKEVFGAKYGGHFLLNKKDLVVKLRDDKKDDLLVKGHKPYLPGGGLYKYTELAPDVTVLMEGGQAGNLMPQMWYRVNKQRDGQRVFYMRYDPRDVAKDATTRDLVVRAMFWAANRDPAAYKK